MTYPIDHNSSTNVSILSHLTILFNHLFTETPQAPTIDNVTRESPTSATVKWSPPKSDGGSEITGYVLEKKEKMSPRWSLVTESETETSFTVKGLPDGENVEFRVSAVNKAGTGKPSQVATLSAKPPGAPDAPEVSDIDRTSATVTWTVPSSDGGSTITGYTIERREKGRDRWTRVNKSLVKETTLKVNDLTEKNQYEFRVIAENKVGPGEPATHLQDLRPRLHLVSSQLCSFLNGQFRNHVKCKAILL